MPAKIIGPHSCRKCGFVFEARACPECSKAKHRRYRVEKPEISRRALAKYRATHKEDLVIRRRANYQRHKSERAAYNKAWRERNREYDRARIAEWDARNKERRRAKAKARYEAHREEQLDKNRAWRLANPAKRVATQAKRRAKERALSGAFSAEDFLRICASQKQRCAICGKRKRLQADHIIPLSQGGSSHPWNIQGLCQPCNARKSNKISTGAQFGLFDKTELAA